MDLLAIRDAQIDYLTTKGAAGNVAGACSVPLLLMDKASNARTRALAQQAYAACAAAMVAMDALTEALGDEMARVQVER